MSDDKSLRFAKNKAAEINLTVHERPFDVLRYMYETGGLEGDLAAAFRAGAAWGASEATKRERIVVPRDTFERGMPDMKPGTITHYGPDKPN